MNHIKSFLLLAVVVFTILSCKKERQVERSPFRIDAVETTDVVSVGYDIALEKPFGWKEAVSYSGFQPNRGVASIKVKEISTSIDELKKEYSDEQYSTDMLHLLALRPVIIAKSDTGLFVVIRNNYKKVTNYQFAFSKNNRIVSIEAFSQVSDYELYDLVIINCLKSLCFKESQPKSEYFTLAKVKNATSIIYTRDGKYPTEHKDHTMLQISTTKYEYGMSIEDVLKEILRKRGLENGKSIGVDILDNAKLASTITKDGDKNLYYELNYFPDKTASLIKIESSNSAEFQEAIRQWKIGSTKYVIK